MEHKLKIPFKVISICLIVFSCMMIGCKEDSTRQSGVESEVKTKPRVKVPRFDGDSAYAFVEKQLSFGYRVPGTPESIACKNWMVKKLGSYGAQVSEQKFTVDFLGREGVTATNVIAVFNPEKKQRVLLTAHWDSRLIAEKDPDKAKQDKPIYGADDGASGTAALIEIARIISQNPIDLGIDIVLFDAEDQGESGTSKVDSWALGAQYYSKNPHVAGYDAEFGILLDMVGAKNARFGKEGYSRKYAGKYVDKIWKLAQSMGNGHLFQNVNTGPIADDHYYLNTILGVPTVDIINIPYDGSKTFGDHHHTHSDNIDIIDKRTLRTVGQVVTAVIYKTSDNSFL